MFWRFEVWCWRSTVRNLLRPKVTTGTTVFWWFIAWFNTVSGGVRAQQDRWYTQVLLCGCAFSFPWHLVTMSFSSVLCLCWLLLMLLLFSDQWYRTTRVVNVLVASKNMTTKTCQRSFRKWMFSFFVDRIVLLCIVWILYTSHILISCAFFKFFQYEHAKQYIQASSLIPIVSPSLCGARDFRATTWLFSFFQLFLPFKSIPEYLSRRNANSVLVTVVTMGQDAIFGTHVDNVGTVLSPLQLPLFWKSTGLILSWMRVLLVDFRNMVVQRLGMIGDVFSVDHVMHHDRRIPIPGFEDYGIGSLTLRYSKQIHQLADTLGYKTGTCSTGTSWFCGGIFATHEGFQCGGQRHGSRLVGLDLCAVQEATLESQSRDRLGRWWRKDSRLISSQSCQGSGQSPRCPSQSFEPPVKEEL